MENTVGGFFALRFVCSATSGPSHLEVELFGAGPKFYDTAIRQSFYGPFRVIVEFARHARVMHNLHPKLTLFVKIGESRVGFRQVKFLGLIFGQSDDSEC